MSNLGSNTQRFNFLRRIEQISENHCGPAVIQMLLENIGITKTQEEITQAAGATQTIMEHGTRIDQLAKAVHQLAPSSRLWYKEKATLDDVRYVLEECKYPVGVEWQGLFGEAGEEDDDDDYGHYSIISHINNLKDEMIIVDPYKDFADQDRILKISLFLRRWWDYNEVKNLKTNKKYFKKDEQLFFVVTPLAETFPDDLQMKYFY